MSSTWLRDAAARLDAAGVDSPVVDAEMLAAHAARLPRSSLMLLSAPPPGYATLLERRVAREPLQHITGTAAFRHLELVVGAGVLVPRPETEVVAGEAIAAAASVVAAGRRPIVVDLGTGSAAIALSVAAEVPGAEVVAVELYDEAYRWAATNIDRWRRANDRHPSAVTLYLGDLTTVAEDGEPLSARRGQVDVVVSNPPYLDEPPAQPEARHDPMSALQAGADGSLHMLRATLRTAAALLRPGGKVVMEHGEWQAEAVRAAAATADLVDGRTGTDLTGRPRFLAARRRGAEV